MAELRSGPLSASDLAFELRERVVQLSNSLSTDDAALANSLATILTYFARLSSLRVAPSTSSTSHTPNDAPPPVNMYESLSRQLTDLQFERLVSQPPGLSSTTTETAILWTQIDRELENVAALCKDRSEPPQYDFADEETLYDFDSPPEYDGAGRPSLDLKRGDTKLERMTSLTSRISDEKMRLDLEGIARAIDRLYVVAPQLHNQRVELKSSKVRELEKARAAAASKGSGSSRKGKERELQSIIEMLGKASERGLSDQSVVLENGVMQSRLEKAKMKDLAKVRCIPFPFLNDINTPPERSLCRKPRSTFRRWPYARARRHPLIHLAQQAQRPVCQTQLSRVHARDHTTRLGSPARSFRHAHPARVCRADGSGV